MGKGLFEYISEQCTSEPERPKEEPLNPGIASTIQLRQAALQIIEKGKADKEAAAGCKLQILKDIENKQNPYRILLTAAETISRLSGDDDNYFLQVQKKLIEVYGSDMTDSANL